MSFEGRKNDLDFDEEEESIKIADEFGLHYVETTSVISERKPLQEIKNINKNSFASKHKHSGASHNSKLNTVRNNETSDLPHFKRGFNGMGGQSKTLVIPSKKPGSGVKHGSEKKGALGFNKIPKNNTKITKFITQRSASTAVNLL